MPAKVNGEQKTLPKRDLVIMKLVAKALNGDARAIERLIDLDFGEVANTNDRLTETPLTPEQEEQLARVLKRKRK